MANMPRRITIRMTEEEYECLQDSANAAEMSIGAFVRQLIIDSSKRRTVPKVPKHDKGAKSKGVFFRLSDREYQHLKGVSAASGLSSSSILRSIVRRTTPPKLLSVDDKRILIDLKRIGNNFNQIAAVANKNQTIDELYLRENIADLSDVLEHIRQMHGM